MESTRQITMIQAAAILVSTIIGVGVLALPLFAVRAANTGAPLVTFAAIVAAYGGLWIVTKLGLRFPDKSFVRYSETIIGRIPATVGSIMIILFFAVLTSLASREFGAVVVTSVLRETPLEVTVIVMLLLAAISTRHDMRTFSYIHLFYTPFLLMPGIIIVALSLKNAESLYLQPVYGNMPPDFLGGLLTIAALFQGSFVMSLVIPKMRHPQKAIPAGLWGFAIAGGLYFMIVVATVAVFGPEEVKNLTWPTLELAKTTSLPANILERLDAAFLSIWVTAVFTTLFSSYYLTVHYLSDLLRLRDHRLFSWFVAPFVFLIAMLPQNVVMLYDVIVAVGRIGLILTIVYPLFLLLVAMIRQLKG